MPYSKEQRKKYRLNFNWKKMEDSDEPYYEIYNEWLKTNGLKNTEETREIFRKCYSIYNNKKNIFNEIIQMEYRIGLLQSNIDEAQTEIDQIQAKAEKYKHLCKMTIKPTNYEKFHYTWNNSIVDTDKPKKRKRIQKTEEFILGYLLKNDELFNQIVVARKLMGKEI